MIKGLMVGVCIFQNQWEKLKQALAEWEHPKANGESRGDEGGEAMEPRKNEEERISFITHQETWSLLSGWGLIEQATNGGCEGRGT